MEFIPESLFNSDIGKNFLTAIYVPIFKGTTDVYNLDVNDAFNFVKSMVCGGSMTVSMENFKETIVNQAGELEDIPKIIEVNLSFDGGILEDYKKKISKLNDKLTNLQDSLTSIITSATSYVAAVAIPFSMAAGIAGIMSTIGQLKGLKNIIGDVRDLLEECNLSGDALDSLVPGAGTAISAVLDLIEGTVTVLTSIIPV